MSTAVDLDRFAALDFTGRAERIAIESEQRIASIKSDLAGRGFLTSSLWLNALRLELIRRTFLVAQARIESVEAAHAAMQVPLTRAALRAAEDAAVTCLVDAADSIHSTMREDSERIGMSQIWAEALVGRDPIRRDLDARRIELQRLTEMRALTIGNMSATAQSGQRWDVFLSHASEDKEGVVVPLHKALLERGARVWIDSIVLKLGDSLRATIDTGLASSRYGVVVLSRAFFAKRWPQQELNALFAREHDGNKVILPVVCDLTDSDLAAKSPLLVDRVYVRWNAGLETVTDQIMAVVGTQSPPARATGDMFRANPSVHEDLSGLAVVGQVQAVRSPLSYTASDIATLADAELDDLKRSLISDRDDIRSNRAPRDQPKLLAPTDGLLALLRQEYVLRRRPF